MKEGMPFYIFLIFLTSAFDTLNQLCLKSAINKLDVSLNADIGKILKFILRLIAVPRLWLSFLFSIISLCIWLFVLSKVELNWAFSVDSMHYILIALVSSVFLKEKVNFKRWLGTGLIILGIALVTMS